MRSKDSKRDTRIPEPFAEQFLIILALLSIAAGILLVYLLNYNLGGVGNLVIIAGLAGLIGSSLSPLLARDAETGLQGSTKGGLTPRTFTSLFVYLLGGFGVASVAFVLTSALLLDEPGVSTNDLGTVAFGGVIGFFVGREITRRSLGWQGVLADASPAVVTALGNFEDQLLGQALMDYDGYIVASLRPSPSPAATIGRLLIYMVARSAREQEISSVESSEALSTATMERLLLDKGRVLVHGGKDADLVPFAISIISTTLDVQPQQLVLAAPAEGKSETIGFTLLAPQRSEGKLEDGWSNSLPDSVPVYIDVSQAGRTVQLFDIEIPIHGRE